MKNYFITTDRGKFHYRTYGNPQNPALVAIHGYPQSSYCWKEVAELLEDEYYIITPDLRGMGDSERTLEEKHYAKDELGKDIISILDDLNIDKFYLAGHDWGSGVAQEVTYQAMPRIKKFVTMNFPITHNDIGKLKAYQKLGERLFSSFWYQFFLRMPGLPETFLAGNEEYWIRFTMRGKHPISEEGIKEYIRCHQIPNSITTFANLYRTMKEDMARWANSEFTNKKIPLDVLIIHGALDTVIVTDYYHNVENCYDKVRLEFLDSGHFVLDELPTAVAELMRGYLK
jgi:haloacetate dehalogenase